MKRTLIVGGSTLAVFILVFSSFSSVVYAQPEKTDIIKNIMEKINIDNSRNNLIVDLIYFIISVIMGLGFYIIFQIAYLVYQQYH